MNGRAGGFDQMCLVSLAVTWIAVLLAAAAAAAAVPPIWTDCWCSGQAAVSVLCHTASLG